jgi:hypothetical protein
MEAVLMGVCNDIVRGKKYVAGISGQEIQHDITGAIKGITGMPEGTGIAYGRGKHIEGYFALMSDNAIHNFINFFYIVPRKRVDKHGPVVTPIIVNLF